MNEELFQSHEALTFDDLLIVPGYTAVLPDQTDVRARLTRGITLNIPLVSAAMDTVTEARMAIALAREGGIGIIHRNLSPGGAGRRSREGQALRIGHDHRSGHPCPHGHAARGGGPDGQIPHQRRADHRPGAAASWWASSPTGTSASSSPGISTSR